ncbi:hypothetical protein [Pedobacter endophyticus]|uniref:Uncharacterized protein n=1 Tax=Pedobacter endophyticus TaxID=2789740 RepID=A0A7S9L127_9SPHI|nr:hypothetical protein [Pedobacter endophyticus]QPH40531.1 hypothetical protein IZT61_04420 [Pedobacter endophyticus]
MIINPDEIEDTIPEANGEKPIASGVRSEYRRGGARKCHKMATQKRKKRLRKSGRVSQHSLAKIKKNLSSVKKAHKLRLKKIQKIKAKKIRA